MTIDRPDTDQVIRDPEQLLAISSPVRNAIHTVVLNQGETSVREIAYQLGMKPASLYRHIDALLEAGVIEEVGTTPTERRDAKLYATRLAYFEYQPSSPEMLAALMRMVRLGMKASAERFSSAAAGGEAVPKGKLRDLYYANHFSWMDDDQIVQINEHMNAITDIMLNNERREGARPLVVTLGLSPMEVRENPPA